MVAKICFLSLLAAIAVAEPIAQAKAPTNPDVAGSPGSAEHPFHGGYAAESGRPRHGQDSRHGHGHGHGRNSGITSPSATAAPTTLYTSVAPTSAPVVTATTSADDDEGDDAEGGDDTADQSGTLSLIAADQPSDGTSSEDADLEKRTDESSSAAPASTSRRRRRYRTRTRSYTPVAEVIDIVTITTIVTASGTPDAAVTSVVSSVISSVDAVQTPAFAFAPAPAPAHAPAPAPAPAPSSSRITSAAPAVTSAAGPAIGSKKGLSYNDATYLNPWAGKASWAYNWSPKPDGTLPSGMSFIPMKWCPEASISAGNIASFSSSVAASGATRVLSFNEPDLAGQCNIDVSRAVAGHKAYFAPIAAKGGIKVGSPAVTNGGGAMGLTYLGNFLKQCGLGKDCPVDFLAVHWYGDSAADFKRHVTAAMQLATDHGLTETYVTEFALNGDDNTKQAAFVSEVVPWLEQQAGIGGYAYFMASDGKLMSGKSISDGLGTAYSSA